jgi:hypothetical protein
VEVSTAKLIGTDKLQKHRSPSRRYITDDGAFSSSVDPHSLFSHAKITNDSISTALNGSLGNVKPLPETIM